MPINIPKPSALILEAYKIIGNKTPINTDCGKLCRHVCCVGGENDGMILFPGEARFMPIDGFTLSRCDLRGVSIDFAVCYGRCNRVSRPLACRMYPFVPYFDGSELKVIPDPRARICPLLRDDVRDYISNDFLSALNQAFVLLWDDEEICEFIRTLSLVLGDYMEF